MILSQRLASGRISSSDTAALLQQVLAQALQKSPSSREIPAAALKALAREFQVRTYAPREVVFVEGQASDTAFLILRGLATVTYLDARHRRVLLAVIGPGELCGGGEAMPEALRGRLRCDAVQTCVIATLGYQRLVELLFGVSAGRLAAGTSLLFGARDACLAREVLARGKNLRQRLLEVIGDLGARFGVPDARGVILDLPLTHEDLADLVGASRPKVTREIRLLENEGIIARQGRRLVIATKKL